MYLLTAGAFDEKIAGLSLEGAVRYKELAAVMLSREYIEYKLGFAYLSGRLNSSQELKELPRHIASTRQLLCSSCQTIYLDTYSLDDLYDFC